MSKRTYDNADYWECDQCEDSSTEQTAKCADCGSEEITAIHSDILIPGSWGIYIPLRFYEHFDFKKWHLCKDDYKDLKEPGSETYWDTWDSLMGCAQLIDKDNHTWLLEQEGDLRAVLHINK